MPIRDKSGPPPFLAGRIPMEDLDPHRRGEGDLAQEGDNPGQNPQIAIGKEPLEADIGGEDPFADLIDSPFFAGGFPSAFISNSL